LIIPSLCWKENNMAVVASATGAAVFGLSGVAAGLAGGALLGAGIGGLYSAVTGDGDILNSMLTGGLIGGAAGGLGAAYAGPAAAAEAATAAGATGAGTIGPAATTVATPTAALTSANTAGLNALAANSGVIAEGAASTLPGLGMTVAPEVVTPAMIEAGKAGALKTAAGLTGKEMLGYGLAGTTAMQLLGGKGKGAGAPGSSTDPGNIRPYTFSPNQTAAGDFPSPYATAQYDAAGMPIMDTRERNYFDQQYTALTPYSARAGTENPNVPVAAAAGGLMAAGGPVERMTQNMMGGQGNMYPLSQQDHTNFATPTQMPASAEVIRSDYDAKTQPYTGVMMARGGIANLGDYSDGGRLLKGPGDGVSDDIPATIAGKQPARLADGEFVIPARIVSEIGNGSTDAGAKRLYAMMDRIQAGRKKTIGKKNVAKDTKAKKHLLA
jgi:hypothetical protein